MTRVSMKAIILILLFTCIGNAVMVYCGQMVQGDVIPFEGLYFDQMRMQALYLKTQLGISGTITQIAFRVQLDDPSVVGYYYNTKITLCHTDLDSLTTEFSSNYNGYTPIDTVTGMQAVVPGIQNSWVVFEFTIPFAYNNNHNLIVEIQWDGDDEDEVPVWVWEPGTSLGKYRLYSDNLGSTSGTADGLAYYMRFLIGGIPVEANSLGRIKGMYTP